MRCAVLGDPIEHSLSPVLHRAAYAALGLDWTYDAVRVAERRPRGFLAGLDDEWRGLSLTMPLKREVDAAARPGRRDRARLAGAANTLLLDDDGRRTAHNTDVPGRGRGAARARRRRRWSGPSCSAAAPRPPRCCSRWPTSACRHVALLVRDPARAAETLAAVAARTRPRPTRRGRRWAPARRLRRPPTSWSPPSRRRPQTAGAGRRGWPTSPVVFDVVYDPWPTPLAAAAAAAGRTLVGGLDLLVHQAVLPGRADDRAFDVPRRRRCGAAGEAALRRRRPVATGSPVTDVAGRAALAAARSRPASPALCRGSSRGARAGRPTPEPEPAPEPTRRTDAPTPGRSSRPGALRRHRRACPGSAGAARWPAAVPGALLGAAAGLDLAAAVPGAAGAGLRSPWRWSTGAPGCCPRG